MTTNHLQVLKVLAHTTTMMAEGEILQLLHAGNLKITEEEYFEVINRKTAILMAAACQVGAILGDSPPEREEALTQFGLNLGITFQVVDDILDYTGDEREMGKPIGHDLQEGRLTLPMIHALSQATPPDRDLLLEMAGNLEPGKGPELRRLIEKYGSLDYARSLARKYTLKAQANLEPFPPVPEKAYFWAFTEELLERTH